MIAYILNISPQIMEQFGIPQSITTCITTLFFSTQIQINVNGHITTQPLQQQRGLRQGDPLSPLLFNIALTLSYAVSIKTRTLLALITK
jgi:xanthine/uracil/vitamin C permease (AzgA family)